MIINGKEEQIATPITVAELIESKGRRSSKAPTPWRSSRSCRAAERRASRNHTCHTHHTHHAHHDERTIDNERKTAPIMTFEPSATPEQISARQQAFDNQPDPAMLVSREEIRAALLDRHTAATQDKLDAAHVAICGCGGLGSTVAVALTRIGVGHLHLIDFDRVDMTNLNRQQYFLKDLGQYKTEALRSNLHQINPFIEITIDTVKVTDENVPTLFENESIICEAFDVPENKTMLVNAVLENLPDKKLVSASGMAGFRSSNLVRTRRVSKNFYFCGDGETAPVPGAGLMAPRVGVVACHEANMITRLILGEEDA